MPSRRSLTRRDILKVLARGAIAVPFTSVLGARAAATAAMATPITGGGWEHGLRLGMTTYSTRTLSLDDSIPVIKLLRLSNAAAFRVHCNWETASPEECRAVLGIFADDRIRLQVGELHPS